jgi:hypothetical protein
VEKMLTEGINPVLSVWEHLARDAVICPCAKHEGHSGALVLHTTHSEVLLRHWSPMPRIRSSLLNMPPSSHVVCLTSPPLPACAGWQEQPRGLGELIKVQKSLARSNKVGEGGGRVLGTLILAPVGSPKARCVGELAIQGCCGQVLSRHVAVRRLTPSLERSDTAHAVRSTSPPLSPSLRPWVKPWCPKERVLVKKLPARGKQFLKDGSPMPDVVPTSSLGPFAVCRPGETLPLGSASMPERPQERPPCLKVPFGAVEIPRLRGLQYGEYAGWPRGVLRTP